MLHRWGSERDKRRWRRSAKGRRTFNCIGYHFSGSLIYHYKARTKLTLKLIPFSSVLWCSQNVIPAESPNELLFLTFPPCQFFSLCMCNIPVVDILRIARRGHNGPLGESIWDGNSVWPVVGLVKSTSFWTD